MKIYKLTNFSYNFTVILYIESRTNFLLLLYCSWIYFVTCKYICTYYNLLYTIYCVCIQKITYTLHFTCLGTLEYLTISLNFTFFTTSSSSFFHDLIKIIFSCFASGFSSSTTGYSWIFVTLIISRFSGKVYGFKVG